MADYVLVTGGDRGIGRSIVLRFAREGYYVVFTYYRNRAAADETLNAVRNMGADGFHVQMDVSDPDSVREAYQKIEASIPYLNVLVNNAGIFLSKPTEETSLEEWERIIRVDLTGVFLVTKTFLPLLYRAPWASIVNISSIAGQTGNVVASTAYCAAKAGVIGFTRRLAVELAPRKIRVNAVAPSFVETDMVREYINTPEKRERIRRLHPLGDIAKPEDIAEAVYFLASRKARLITGQVLGINAGRLTC
jgi:3-oxoacyl-[acyl-carrier protein] reductase